MLAPHRFTNFNYCLIYVSSLVVECLLSRGKSTLDELFDYCRTSNSEIDEQDITHVVGFLFVIGRVEYDTARDQVKLIKAKKC